MRKRGLGLFHGTIHPKDRTGLYGVELHGLEINTQGSDLEDCLAMAKDATELLYDDDSVEIGTILINDNNFLISVYKK